MTTITYSPGKIDYNGSGRRNCRVTFSIRWDGRRFSVMAEIWNPRETDCYVCGQVVEEAAAYFPNDTKTQRILAIWRDWHLNDMRPSADGREWEFQPLPDAIVAEVEEWFEAA